MAAPSYIPVLISAFGDKVLLPGTLEYSDRIGSYMSVFESELAPSSILAPTSVNDVVGFIQTLKPFTDNGDVKIAIRGGGHVALTGVANINEGITIDLFKLRGVQVSDDKTSVNIGAGESWGNVYGVLDPLGLAVAGGRASNGGIGGLALSGGFSFFSSREGFICDNVINYQLVLSSGEIINANASENSDLFISLKGGSNNFGIITRFDMRAFEQGNMWGGSVYYPDIHFSSQLEALHNLAKQDDAEDYAHIMISVGYSAQFKSTMCLNTIFYTKPEENPPPLQPFVTMQPQIDQLSSLRVSSPKNFADEQSAQAKPSQRLLYMTTTIKSDLALMQAIVQHLKSTLGPIKEVTGVTYALTLQPITKSMLKASAARGTNSLGLDPTDAPLMMLLIYVSWLNKADDDTVIQTQQDFVTTIDEMAEDRNLSSEYKFMTYAFAGQKVIEGYGAKNKTRLQEVSEKYDPTGFFQRVVPGGFKLFG